jgi:AraC family transcriptional regulator
MSGGRADCAVQALRRVAGLTLAETTYPGGFASPEHADGATLLAVGLEGAVTESRGGHSVLCESGTLVVLPRDAPYAHRFSEAGARCFVVQLGEGWAERMRAFGVAEPSAPVYLRRGRANALAAALYAEFRAADDASRLAIEGYALALLAELARARARGRVRGHAPRECSAGPPWLARATERLDASAADDPGHAGTVGIATIAAEVGVHPVHLARAFREHHGTTMGGYLRRLRVERARAQLATTAKPLVQIALEAGFADQAHFTRVFRALVGVTPGVYRRTAGTARQ